MLRLVEAQALAIGPLEHRIPQARHLAGPLHGRELDEFRLGRGLHHLEQVAKREADPRNHHRPRFDAAQAIDPLLEREALEQILERVVAGLADLAVDLHRPGRRLELAAVGLRVALVGAELVEVVVAGDVLERVELLAGRAERALAYVGERGPAPGRVPRRRQQRAGHAARRGADRGPDEGATIEVEPFVGDLARRNRWCRSNQHRLVPS